MDSNYSVTSKDINVAPRVLPAVLSDDLFWRVLSVVLVLDIIVGVLATGANVVTIIVYLRMGFSDSTNISLASLAISDCGIAVTTVSMALCNLLPSIMTTHFTNSACMSTSALPHVMLTRISALITMYLSIERYLCVRLPLKIKTIITPTRTFFAMATIIIGILSFYPIGFIRYPIGWTFDPERNTTIVDAIPFTDPMAILFEEIFIVVLATIIPFLTFSAVLLCTILLSLSLQKSRAWRDKNRITSVMASDTPGQNPKLALTQSKEIRAVKMMITIATVFIVSSTPSCVHVILAMVVPGFTVYGRLNRLYDVIGLSSVGVNSINSGVNVIIYYRMSYKFRQAVLGMFCQ